MTEAVKDGSAWRVDAQIALEVGSHEALIRMAYKDSVSKWTWAVGMTDATGHMVERYIDNPQPLDHCMAVYSWALDNYADGVRRAFRGVNLSKAQFAAALSFHWNTGAIERATWVKRFRAGNVSGARKAIMNWTTPKSLTDRRKAERALFFDGIWSNDGTMPEYTRLTSRYTPVWSSRVETDVSAALRAAFDRPAKPKLDRKPKPDNKPGAPTLSPPNPTPRPERSQKPASKRQHSPSVALPGKSDQTPSAGKGGWNAGIAAVIAVVGGALAMFWQWLAMLPCDVLGIMCG